MKLLGLAPCVLWTEAGGTHLYSLLVLLRSGIDLLYFLFPACNLI